MNIELIVDIPYLSRKKRFYLSCLSWGSFVFLFLISYCLLIDIYWPIIILFVFLFVVYIFYCYKESEIYIVKILKNGNKVTIEYYKGENYYKIDTTKDELKIKWYSTTIGNFSSDHIDFICGKVRITQYNVGEWDKEKFKIVYSKLK